MKKVKIFCLLTIILLAAFLRFWRLDQYPAGINADEASYAYNAYSLILTGKDEHGETWPVHLKSFADYKPAGTAYILIPFIKFFGLTEMSLRVPSAIAGVASILLIFLLVKKLFTNDWLAFSASLFLAISPWHIHFSRGGWETNLATFFLLFGLYLFFKALKNHRLFPFSILVFVFSLYTYHSPRVVIPLLGVFLLLVYRKSIFKNLRWIMIAVVVGMILLTPFVFDFFGPAVSARFGGVSIFSDTGPFWRANRLRGEHQDPGAILVRLLHNRPVNYGLEFFQNYLDHFDGTFLFVLGDRIKRSNSPDMGQMYLFDFIFLIAGVYFLFKKRPQNWPVPFLWLLLAPIPAALTFQTPNALRAHNMVIPLVIISAYGFYNLLLLIKGKFPLLFRVTCYVLLVTFISWNFSYFLHQYFVYYPKTYPEAWEYGFKELVGYLWPIKDKYSKIYVTERYDQPYIIFLFYLKYSPEKFQKEVVLTPRDKFGFSTVRDFDKFHFENIVWDELKDKKNILIVGTDEEIPDSATIIKTIYFKNNQPAFRIAET